MENQTTKIKVKYFLSQTGQRASLQAGGDGKKQQTCIIDAPADIFALAHIHENGVAHLTIRGAGAAYCDRLSQIVTIDDRGRERGGDFDAIFTPESLVEYLIALPARLASERKKYQAAEERK